MPRRRTPIKGPKIEEWDFSDCPNGEVEYCCYYEYARESEGIRQRVAAKRASIASPFTLYPGDLVYYETEWFEAFFEKLPEFPDVPWLSIKPNIRKAACDSCREWEGPFQSVSPERLPVEEDSPPVHYPTDVGALSLHTVHTVEVDWTATDDAIELRFRQWVKDNRPTAELIWEKRGRVTDRELLKFLGASRLLGHFHNKWDDVVNWVEEHGRGTIHTPNYSDQSGWLRASKKAKSLMKQSVVLSPAASLQTKLDLSGMGAVEEERVRVLKSHLDRTGIGRETRLAAEAQLQQYIEQRKSGS